MISRTNTAKRKLPDIAEYRILFEQSPDAIYITGERDGFADVNHCAANLLGYTKTEMLKLNVYDICANSSDWDNLKKTTQKNGSARTDRIRLIRRDGTEMDGMMTVALRTTSDERILGYHGTIHDMGNREQETLELRESEEKFRQLSDASFEGIIIQDQCTILVANQTYARYMGYNTEEMVGRNILDFVAPEYRDYVLEKMVSGFVGFDQVVCLRRDGTTFLTDVSLRRTYYQGREVLICAVRDKTEQVRMENDLKESEEKLRIMFESITEGVIVYDLDGRILQLNDATAQLNSVQSKEELIGKNVLDLIAARDRTRAKRNMLLRLQNMVTQNAEYLCLRKDGSKFSAEISASLMRNKVGTPVGYVAVIRDITERKKAERNIQFYVSEITKAHEEERRRLACELHDETVQSLSALSLDIEAINRKELNLPAVTAQQLKSLRSKTNDIIRKVRRFSHELRPGVLDRLGLVSAIEILVSEMEEKKVNAQFKGIGVERRLSPEIELALFRITQEALRNVSKHSKANECVVEVDFSPGIVKLMIYDNGMGFDHTGEQSELAKRGKLGLIGMGERASLIGADFSVESNPGKGTTVKIEVPG